MIGTTSRKINFKPDPAFVTFEEAEDYFSKHLVAARTFLILNGVDLDATQDEKVLAFLNLAEGAISEEELADWIRKRIQL